MRLVVPSILLTLGLALPAMAADLPADSHEQAATELLTLMNIERTMLGGAAAMADAMVQQNPMLGPYRGVILKWAGSFMIWETFGPRFVSMFTDAFTESELREMTVFYKTPAGQKSLAVMPELMHREALLGAEMAKLHGDELEQMIRDRATELEKQSAKP